MKHGWFGVWCGVFLVWGMCTADAGSRFGVGVHYWQTVDDLDFGDLQEDGVSYVLSYQNLWSDLSRLQLDLEIFPDDFVGNTEPTYQPQAYITLGTSLYAGLGVGISYSDGEFADDPFYALRAGLELELLPGLVLDVHGNYRFEDFSAIRSVDEDVDTDVVTLGAAARVAF